MINVSLVGNNIIAKYNLYILKLMEKQNLQEKIIHVQII